MCFLLKRILHSFKICEKHFNRVLKKNITAIRLKIEVDQRITHFTIMYWSSCEEIMKIEELHISGVFDPYLLIFLECCSWLKLLGMLKNWVGVSGWLRLGFYVCNSGLGLFIFNDWVSLAGKGPNGKVVLLWRICLDLLQHPFSQFFVHHVCIIARYFSNFLPSWFFRPTRHVLGWRWLHISELSNVQNLISISQVDNVLVACFIGLFPVKFWDVIPRV